MAYLLDTNVISELVKPSPNPQVIDFLTHNHDLYISVIQVYEIRFGLAVLPEGQRKKDLTRSLSNALQKFEKRTLTLDLVSSEKAAELRANAQSVGVQPEEMDCLIAGIASASRIAVATRNTKDFQNFGIDVFNPWNA